MYSRLPVRKVLGIYRSDLSFSGCPVTDLSFGQTHLRVGCCWRNSFSAWFQIRRFMREYAF